MYRPTASLQFFIPVLSQAVYLQLHHTGTSLYMTLDCISFHLAPLMHSLPGSSTNCAMHGIQASCMTHPQPHSSTAPQAPPVQACNTVRIIALESFGAVKHHPYFPSIPCNAFFRLRAPQQLRCTATQTYDYASAQHYYRSVQHCNKEES
jgi:hypothetical protein